MNEENKLESVRRLVRSTYNNLEKISNILDKIEQEERKEVYKSLPGVEGVFDGFYLVSSDGTKHDVPANYAAKSRLAFGDKLKKIDENGKVMFKQIEKVPRKKIEGVLSKKEGKWYILSDSGSYRISDTAAEFNKAGLNTEATAFIPEDNLRTPFATLDKVKTKDSETKESKEVGKEAKKEVNTPPKKPAKPKPTHKEMPVKEKAKTVEPKVEYVNNIAGLEDDDLR